MGMFDALSNQTFAGPDYSMGNNSQGMLTDFLNYKNSQQAKQLQFQKDLAEFQSQQKLKDLAGTMKLQQDAENQAKMRTVASPNNGMNTVFKDYIDPYKQAQLGIQNEKLAQNAKTQEEKNNISMSKNDIAKQRADTYEDMSNQQHLIPMKTLGGDNVFIDSRTGNIVRTGVASGTQTQEEAANTKLTNAKDLENTKETNRETLSGKRGDQIIKQIEAKGNQARLTKQTESPNASANLPSQQAVATRLAAQKLMNSNPELAGFIKIDPNNGMVNVTPPGPGGFFGNSGPNQQQYQQMLNALYPGKAPLPLSKPSAFGTTPPVPQGNSAFTNNPNNKLIRVKLPDGTTGSWDLNKGAVPQGVTVIGGGQ